ncbi:MAG TPA: serine/threonine-protein kinase, partial [Dongiaceae bacterium]|nr:serine/threonine-protein kinase [Dongiaceae bacterium]
MSLATGARLGPYEIVAPLGAGGMGEVYRARDTRLGRDVAVKVLPQHLSANPEVRARFEREAKTVSALNHPNICTLFDVGRDGGADYLVMELVEGETLGERLLRGPLATAEVLKLGAQIADALDRAHRAGVIHRDLKPGNVMLTKTGAKLMDFGLARATGLAGAAGGATVLAVTQSPTMAVPLTAEGTIVGTFQYMSPEQLEGKESDARSDLWALGCVLYEMATGKRAFEAASQASLIGAIMHTEPAPMTTLAPMSPPALERVAKQCLAKDPDERWQTAGDVRRELEWIATGSSSVSGVAAIGAITGRRVAGARLAWTM